MRVVEVRKFGGPDVLVPVEVADPVPGPGEVVVNVAAVDTLFVETQIRSGWGGEYFDIKPPYVPGGAVSGEVAAVGDGVDASWIGRGVLGYTGGALQVDAYAERAVVPAGELVPVPDGLGLPEAVSLAHDGTSAYSLFDRAGVRPGDGVLVVGATGGAAVLLIQLASAAGGTVIGAARGRRKLDLASELGATTVVDYSEPDWPERVRAATGGHGARVVFDGVGGEIGLAAFGAVAAGGWMSAHGAPTGGFTAADPAEVAARKVTLHGIAEMRLDLAGRRHLVTRALADAAAGRVAPVIGQTFPLERAAEAHAAIEARTVIGKTLLIP